MTAEFPLAVHALVYLNHTQSIVSSQVLADNICTNPARVRKVMTRLCRAGLAQSKRGQGTGYLVLPGTPSMTLGEVLRALEETPVSMNWRSGDMDRECLISSGMGEIMDGVYGRLNAACWKELETETIGSISDMIFKKEK